MKTILITRSWCDKDIKNFVIKMAGMVEHIIVCVDLKKDHGFTKKLISHIPKVIILEIKPWSNAAGALNKGLDKAYNLNSNAILIMSKEVDLVEKHLVNMKKELKENYNNLLVTGYALRDENKQGHFMKQKFDYEKFAYGIPWNTCALWNTNLFKEYVEEFNIISDNDFLWHRFFKIDGKLESTYLSGMEDALAIMEAVNNNNKLKSLLLAPAIPWKRGSKHDEQHKEHKIKLERKGLTVKKYSEFLDIPIPSEVNYEHRKI